MAFEKIKSFLPQSFTKDSGIVTRRTKAYQQKVKQDIDLASMLNMLEAKVTMDTLKANIQTTVDVVNPKETFHVTDTRRGTNIKDLSLLYTIAKQQQDHNYDILTQYADKTNDGRSAELKKNSEFSARDLFFEDSAGYNKPKLDGGGHYASNYTQPITSIDQLGVGFVLKKLVNHMRMIGRNNADYENYLAKYTGSQSDAALIVNYLDMAEKNRAESEYPRHYTYNNPDIKADSKHEHNRKLHELVVAMAEKNFDDYHKLQQSKMAEQNTPQQTTEPTREIKPKLTEGPKLLGTGHVKRKCRHNRSK